MQHAPVLEVSGLSFSYDGPPVWAGVDFVLARGQTVVLIGANGAGKSTLLRCIAGWAPPDSGEIHLDGELLKGADRGFRRNLVLVSDAPPFYNDLTAEEHVWFVLRANRAAQREPAARALLDKFGLADHAAQLPSSFSRGMRYKLALVMALALEPAVLLLDEPFGPLDPVSARILVSELLAANARGAAVLLSGHHLPSGLSPDGYLVLEHGRLRAAERRAPADAAVPDDEVEELLTEPGAAEDSA